MLSKQERVNVIKQIFLEMRKYGAYDIYDDKKLHSMISQKEIKILNSCSTINEYKEEINKIFIEIGKQGEVKKIKTLTPDINVAVKEKTEKVEEINFDYFIELESIKEMEEYINKYNKAIIIHSKSYFILLKEVYDLINESSECIYFNNAEQYEKIVFLRTILKNHVTETDRHIFLTYDFLFKLKKYIERIAIADPAEYSLYNEVINILRKN